MVSQATERPTPEKLLITKLQAAETLSVSERTFDRMVNDGTFTKIRIGGGKGVRFSIAELQAFIDRALAAAKPATQDEAIPGMNREIEKMLGGA